VKKVSDKELIKQLEEVIVDKHKEIEKLTELCNKYEEEHKTTFETWQKDIKENELLHSIIKEVREYIETKYDYLLGDDTFLDHDERIDRKQTKHILEILDKVGETDDSKRDV
jgi:cobalamin-dependent methionine synthase I